MMKKGTSLIRAPNCSNRQLSSFLLKYVLATMKVSWFLALELKLSQSTADDDVTDGPAAVTLTGLHSDAFPSSSVGSVGSGAWAVN